MSASQLNDAFSLLEGILLTVVIVFRFEQAERQLEQERQWAEQRAEQAEQQLEQERRLREDLLARLRERGIDPDAL